VPLRTVAVSAPLVLFHLLTCHLASAGSYLLSLAIPTCAPPQKAPPVPCSTICPGLQCLGSCGGGILPPTQQARRWQCPRLWDPWLVVWWLQSWRWPTTTTT